MPQISIDYFLKNAVSKKGDPKEEMKMRNDVFPFSHSVVTAEGAAAAAEMACQCPNLELAIPLRLGMQAAGYVALGNSLWWAVRSVAEIGE